ncbi:ImmA/IrrE family metallo-endopeptidase [Corynebacterium dentalis]|uniref:ImmA/IrrE family metallo-endopeptidase n=1 Tax=Corynebacterium dentalis TaxID=2014528 RepID=UPI0028A2938A|nr:ImmA/IrrE family metallo-endopeptidase [Corynebacterium dentalis]
MTTDSYDALLADLLTRIQNVPQSTAQFLQILTSIAKRTRFMSPFNAMLVEFQRPGAHHAMTISQWEKCGRRPLPFIPGIMILKPFGPCIPVYEFSDTEPLPGWEDFAVDLTPSFELVQTVEDAAPFVERLLEHACHVGIDPLPTRLGRRLAGDTSRVDRGTKVVPRGEKEHHFALRFMVRFNANHAPAVQFQTLVHEYAHVLLGHLGPIDSDTPEQKWDPETRKRTRLPREIQELEAESVAHIVCMSFGVDGNSAEYLRNYVGQTLDNHNTWPADMSITKVSQTASSIMKLLGDYQDIPVRKSIRSVHVREDQKAPSVIPMPSSTSTGMGNQGQLFRTMTSRQVPKLVG